MEKEKIELLICTAIEGCANKQCKHREPHEYDCCDNDCQWGDRSVGPCIPYEIQTGDRVLVLESMRGVIEKMMWSYEMQYEIGKEHIVQSLGINNRANLKGSYFSWPVDHLQYVGRGEKDIFTPLPYRETTTYSVASYHYQDPEPEYVATGKKLPLWELVKSSEIAMHELGNLVEWLAGRSATGRFLRDDIFSIDGFLDHALKHDCFKDFLIENGYIKVKVEEVEEVFYKAGDRFEYDDIEVVVVVQHGSNKMAGLVVQNGCDKDICWAEFVPVADVKKITQEEFGKMCGSTPPSKWIKQ